jgi:hypothetical protein
MLDQVSSPLLTAPSPALYPPPAFNMMNTTPCGSPY